jgi:TM2 domain-containing membrane protein YozV
MASENGSTIREKAADEGFCASCGAIIKKAAEICPKCGVRQKGSPILYGLSSNWLALVLISFFIGAWGVDRFFVGKIGTGLLKLFTCGGAGIWWLIDLILILTENFEDSSGNIIRRESRV